MIKPPNSPLSLNDLIQLILLAKVSDTQRRDLISAIRTVARLLNASPTDIPADAVLLRRRLAGLSPEAVGISIGRWRNLRSLIGKALDLAQPALHAGNQKQPLTPAWQLLWAKLPRNRSIRLLALVRSLGANGVDPEAASLEALERYRQVIATSRLRANPEKVWDSILWAWNKSIEDTPGWPSVRIPRVARRVYYVLDWDAFPPSLKADVDAFAAFHGTINLDGDGPSRPCRRSTLATRTYQIRTAASSLVRMGVAANTIGSISDLVTLEHFKMILRDLMNRGGNKATPQVALMASFLKGVAKHWVKVDDATLASLKKTVSNVSTKNRGLTQKNRTRLGPFDDSTVVAKFLALPDTLRNLIEKDRRPARLKAVMAQTAAAIAILQYVPLRVRNLTEIDLTDNLIERNEIVYLLIPADEVKNNMHIDRVLPESVVSVVAWYVSEYRPHLIRAPTTALFPGAGAKPKSSMLLSDQIRQMIKRHLGIEVHAHLFRHIGAKLFLDARPGEYEVVRQVLGHRSMNTTTNFYAGAEGKAAGNLFAGVVERLLNASRGAKSTGVGNTLRGGTQ
jgi:integrase